MADIYKISIEDSATPNAYRIAQAYVEVAESAKRMRNAVVVGDAALIRAARDVDQLAKGELRAARAAMTAGNAIMRLGPKLGQIKPPSLKKPTEEGFKFSYMLNAMANAAVRAGLSLATRLGGALIDVGKSLYEVADLATRAHMSFSNFFGGQASGDKLLKESIDIAKRYGFTIEDTVAQIQRFGAAGFNQEQSKGLLRFGADMLAAGRSVQDVKGIFLAMTQIQGKGKLQAEELTQQLAERGINAGRVWQILSGKLFHGDESKVQEVMAMQKKGQIKSGMALNAIVQAGVEGVHGSAIGKAGEGVADKTIGGLGRRIGTLWEDAIFEAVDKANPALVKGMQSLFGGFSASSTSGLQSNLTAMLESVGAGLDRIGPKIPAIVDNFTKAFGKSSGLDIQTWENFANSLPGIATNLGAIAGFMAKIAKHAAEIVANPAVNALFGGGPASHEEAFVDKYLKDTGKGAGLMTEQQQALAAENDRIRSAGDSAIADDAGKGIADGLAAGMLQGAPTVGRAAESLGQTAIDASKDTLGAHSPSTVFRGIGSYTAEGFALGQQENLDLVMHSAAMMSNASIGAAGASGLDSRRAIAAGSAAGSAMSSRSSKTSVRVGDIYVGGAGGSGGADAAQEVRSYFETDFIAMLERHLEGVGA